MVQTDGRKKKMIGLIAGFLLCLTNEVKGQNDYFATKQSQQTCGIRTLGRSGRIVGGQEAYQGKWPWQVSVKGMTPNGRMMLSRCGGVLIGAKHVLTAAHCQKTSRLVVTLGEHDRTGVQNRLTPVVRNVRRMFIHPRYNSSTFENDLALLEISPVNPRHHHIRPICLPYHHEDFVSKMAFVTGWGALREGGRGSNILREVQVPIVNKTECQRMFTKAGYKVSVDENSVCAGYSRGGRDACKGDSGGPLMVQRSNGRFVLVGITSRGLGCARPNQPAVYVKVSAYASWILSTLRANRN